MMDMGGGGVAQPFQLEEIAQLILRQIERRDLALIRTLLILLGAVVATMSQAPAIGLALLGALGFGGLDRNVATVQGGRGKLEAAVLFWCTQLGHDLGRLAQDVILYSADEFGYLELPTGLATGSSIMPHKRNPDLFELTRGRAGALTVLQTGGSRRLRRPCRRSRAQ